MNLTYEKVKSGNADYRKYYEAYDERYKTVHEKGIRWFSDNCSPIVSEVIEKYEITQK